MTSDKKLINEVKHVWICKSTQKYVGQIKWVAKHHFIFRPRRTLPIFMILYYSGGIKLIFFVIYIMCICLFIRRRIGIFTRAAKAEILLQIKLSPILYISQAERTHLLKTKPLKKREIHYQPSDTQYIWMGWWWWWW